MIGAIALAAVACGPAILLSGDPDVVEPVAEELARGGLGPPSAGCPATDVRIARADGGLSLELVGEGGRVQRRSLQDGRTAAAVIESLLRPGLVLDVPEPPAPAPPPPPAPVRVLDEVAPTLEASVDSQGAAGASLAVTGVRRMPLADVRLTLRAGVTPSVEVPGYPRAARDEIELLAGLGRTFPVGGVVLSTSLDMGAGRIGARRATATCEPACGGLVLDGASVGSVRPRVAGGVSLAIPAGTSFALALAALADVSPFAAGPRAPGWAAGLPAATAARLSLPPDPWLTLRLGLRLAWSPP